MDSMQDTVKALNDAPPPISGMMGNHTNAFMKNATAKFIKTLNQPEKHKKEEKKKEVKKEPTVKTTQKTQKNNNTVHVELAYTDTEGYLQQKNMLRSIERIYTNPQFDASKKIMLYTSEVCLPEIQRQEEQMKNIQNKTERDNQEAFLQIENKADKLVIPYMCFFTGMSFLKRLPTQDEIRDKKHAIDLEKGFKMKDTFIELAH